MIILTTRYYYLHLYTCTYLAHTCPAMPRTHRKLSGPLTGNGLSLPVRVWWCNEWCHMSVAGEIPAHLSWQLRQNILPATIWSLSCRIQPVICITIIIIIIISSSSITTHTHYGGYSENILTR